MVARLKLTKNGQQYARDDVNGTIDTLALDKPQRRELVQALANNAPLLGDVQKEWRENANKKTAKKEGSELDVLTSVLLISDELATIENEAQQRGGYKHTRGDSKSKVGDLIRRVKQLADDLEAGDLADAGGGIGRGHVQQVLSRIAALTGNQDLASYGLPPEYDAPITAQDRADYRADTREMGVWAGPAEAEALAQALHVQFDIWVIANGRYHCSYPNIGARQVRTGRSLLFLGNHYVVLRQADLVENAVAPEEFPVVAATETRGDCLYEGVDIVASGAKPQNYDQRIRHLRLLASGGMADAAVDTAIVLIRSGSRQGVGSRMSRSLRDAGLRHLAATIKAHDKVGYAKYESDIDRMFKDYAAVSMKTGEEAEDPWQLTALEDKLREVSEELMGAGDDWENPVSVPKTLFRWVSTQGAKDALKDGITFSPEGGGIPTSTKGEKGVAITSGAVSLNALLRIDTGLIPDFKFEYVPTRSKLKEVKIKCDVPAKAISKG